MKHSIWVLSLLIMPLFAEDTCREECHKAQETCETFLKAFPAAANRSDCSEDLNRCLLICRPPKDPNLPILLS